ncbi:hypothetical protein MTX78_08460 [Hymenobacter tibetensis]|uniref:Glycosyltransferase RgtA/B/C/D-like domain-containing protein n=1 Tax=Hymenobacter tibetensis TaxID=497967 RepID=A0ABY4D4Z5_9BACT|nr:hypothetical protein [Hymenobacter tibetensis]UOG76620.1 hypothetical protein MTX78_08460 [Hymenobacter tibetensis]
MKLALAILLNAALAALFWRWLRTQLQDPQLGRWLLPTLALKLLAWVAACWNLSSDALYIQVFSNPVTRQLRESFPAWLETATSDAFHYQDWHLVFHGYSNTFFMWKIVSVLNLFSMHSLWLNALYYTLFSFVACWMLVRTIADTFPATPKGAALVGFLVWPTVVYWSAGLTKECLVVGSAAGLLAVFLQWLYNNKPFSAWSVVVFVLMAVLQFKMRYFFAALLFSAMGGLTVVWVVQQLGGARRRWIIVAVFAVTIGAGAWVGSEVSLIFRQNRITLQLLRNYNELSRQSGTRPRIKFDDLRPTTESVAQNAPQAAWEALSRPWFWEAGVLYKVVGMENVVLLGVLGVALVAACQGRGGRLPFALVVAVLFYCVAMAVLLGLSTPNLGTLNRYRVALLPLLLWLALQNEYAARLLRRVGL